MGPPGHNAANLPAKMFAVIFGSFLGLALLKFCTPSVMDRFVEAPTKDIEWIIFVWPLRIAYPLVGLVVFVGLFAIRWRSFAPRWLMALPVIWLL